MCTGRFPTCADGLRDRSSISWSRPACAATAEHLPGRDEAARGRLTTQTENRGGQWHRRRAASKKDRALLRELPHLVIDGAAVAARAVGASEAIIAFSESDDRSARSLARALGERGDAGRHGEPRVALVEVPERYLSGQESALVNLLSEARESRASAPGRLSGACATDRRWCRT